MNMLKTLIDTHSVISFDVFDTLIKRNVADPDDLFAMVERRYPKEYKTYFPFVSERKAADKKARKTSPYREVNIDEIYNVIKQKFGEVIANRLKNLEIEVELDFCIGNSEILKWYQYCRSQNKKIYILSDMYFPAEIIERILGKNGITGYNHLFSSCDERVTKWGKGDLFVRFLETEGITSDEVLHIGNDKRADFDMARKAGLDAYLISDHKKRISYFGERSSVSGEDQLSYACLKRFCQNHLTGQESREYQIGFEVFGPLLNAYLLWMHQKVRELHIDKIFFFSRDGYVLQRGFKAMQFHDANCYFWASRRAIIVPYLQFCHNLEEMVQCYRSWPRQFTMEVLFTRLGLQIEQYTHILAEYGFQKNTVLNLEQIKADPQIQLLFKEIEPSIIVHSKEQSKLLLAYMKKEKMNGRIAIVDVGAKCSIELALRKLVQKHNLEIDPFGIYINIFQEENQKRYSYFNATNDKAIVALLRFCYMFLEVFLSAPHGTVLGYTEKDGEVKPVTAKYEYEKLKEEQQKIQDLQDGAVAFTELFQKELGSYVTWNHELVLRNFQNFGLTPAYEDAVRWGDFRFWADSFLPMAKPQSRMYYLRHGSSFINDLRDSLWPAGFLMRLMHSKYINQMLFYLYESKNSNQRK